MLKFIFKVFLWVFALVLLLSWLAGGSQDAIHPPACYDKTTDTIVSCASSP